MNTANAATTAAAVAAYGGGGGAAAAAPTGAFASTLGGADGGAAPAVPLLTATREGHCGASPDRERARPREKRARPFERAGAGAVVAATASSPIRLGDPDPEARVSEWSAAEDALLMMKMWSDLGNEWGAIATHLPGRDDTAVMNRTLSLIHWNSRAREGEDEAVLDRRRKAPKGAVRALTSLRQVGGRDDGSHKDLAS